MTFWTGLKGFFKVIWVIIKAIFTFLFTTKGIGWKHTFAFLFLLWVIYSGVKMSHEANDPSLFFVNLQHEIADIDKGIIKEVDGLIGKKTDLGVLKWYHLVFPAIKIFGSLFFIYYLYTIVKKLLHIKIDQSRPEDVTIWFFIGFLIALKFFTFMLLINAQGIPFDWHITGLFSSAPISVGDWINLIPPPILSLKYLFVNYAVWLI